jgi:hypothetical protein
METNLTLKELQEYIGAWGDKTFPSHHNENGSPNARGPLYHLIDPIEGEVFELQRAFESGGNIAVELADCVILLLTMAHLCGVDLSLSLQAKMYVNEQRKWGPPDANGVCTHV